MGYVIAHVGAFDFENFGDLLFTDVLEKQLKRRIPIDEILYFAPKKCKMPNRNIEINSVVELEEIVRSRKIDAIIVGGGDLIHLHMFKTYMPHISQEWVQYEVLYMWVIPCIVAQKYQVPLLWNAPGVPLKFREEEKKIVSYLFDSVDYISVRDYESKNELEKALPSSVIHVVPDTVLSIRDFIPREKLTDLFNKLNFPFSKKKYVFFQCKMPKTDSNYEECIDALRKIKKETDWGILLQPIGYSVGDEDVLKEFERRAPGEFLYSPRHYDQYEILALIANAAIYIGTSLHGYITANSYGTKSVIVNICNYNKITGFNKLIGNKLSMVNTMDKIFEAYLGLEDTSETVIQQRINEISLHFDRLAEIIKCSKKVGESNSKKLADYIYDNLLKIEQMHTQKKDLEDFCSQLQKRFEEEEERSKGYKEAYDNLLNSNSWKFTAPLRKISNIFKK